MGMSTFVVGYRPADEIWNKMKKVWDACEDLGVPPPSEVENYFDGEAPGDKPGMEIDLGDASKEWSNDYSQGYEIDVTKLPEGVRYIRFKNSW